MHPGIGVGRTYTTVLKSSLPSCPRPPLSSGPGSHRGISDGIQANPKTNRTSVVLLHRAGVITELRVPTSYQRDVRYTRRRSGGRDNSECMSESREGQDGI